METSLHRQLKEIYAGEGGDVEVRRGRYRIDAIRGDLLIEVQRSGLASIRAKIADLLALGHRVLVVKPIIACKRIVKHLSKDGAETSSRRSPKRGSALDFIDDLVHFGTVFPHERLVIETPLVEIEEHRFPGAGKRRRRRATDYQIADQKLIEIMETREYRSARDLLSILPKDIPDQFDTACLASHLKIQRFAAQRIAYGLRTVGALIAVGKHGNAVQYERAS